MDETVSTPGVKNDKKREATSPPIPDDNVTEKKTRHVTGDGAIAQLHVYDSDTHDVGKEESMLQDETDESTVVRMLTQPLNLNDIGRIATELRSLMLPKVKSAVKDAVKEATAPLQTQINDLKTENSNLKTKVDELEKKVATNEANIDSLEQYRRRNTLRISGIPEDAIESTDTKVLDLAGDLNVNLFSHDIDRSHRVGKPSSTKTRDIIVKFSRYNAGRMLYEVRKDLRHVENRDSIFINEDLTKIRSKLLFDARTLMPANHLSDAYSSDGRIFVRDKEGEQHIINSNDNLREFGDVKEAKKELDRLRTLQRLRMRPGQISRPQSQATATGLD